MSRPSDKDARPHSTGGVDLSSTGPSTAGGTARQQKQLLEKLRLFQRNDSANRSCAVCGDLGATYVCMTLGTFVCTTCSGLHREFNHKVKGVSVSIWSAEEVDFIQSQGNQKVRDAYLSRWRSDMHPPPPPGDIDKLRTFIKAAFVEKRWTSSSNSRRTSKSKRAVESSAVGKKGSSPRRHGRRVAAKVSTSKVSRRHRGSPRSSRGSSGRSESSGGMTRLSSVGGSSSGHKHKKPRKRATSRGGVRRDDQRRGTSRDESDDDQSDRSFTASSRASSAGVRTRHQRRKQHHDETHRAQQQSGDALSGDGRRRRHRRSRKMSPGGAAPPPTTPGLLIETDFDPFPASVAPASSGPTPSSWQPTPPAPPAPGTFAPQWAAQFPMYPAAVPPASAHMPFTQQSAPFAHSYLGASHHAGATSSATPAAAVTSPSALPTWQPRYSGDPFAGIDSQQAKPAASPALSPFATSTSSASSYLTLGAHQPPSSVGPPSRQGLQQSSSLSFEFPTAPVGTVPPSSTPSAVLVDPTTSAAGPFFSAGPFSPPPTAAGSVPSSSPWGAPPQLLTAGSGSGTTPINLTHLTDAQRQQYISLQQQQQFLTMQMMSLQKAITAGGGEATAPDTGGVDQRQQQPAAAQHQGTGSAGQLAVDGRPVFPDPFAQRKSGGLLNDAKDGLLSDLFASSAPAVGELGSASNQTSENVLKNGQKDVRLFDDTSSHKDDKVAHVTKESDSLADPFGALEAFGSISAVVADGPAAAQSNAAATPPPKSDGSVKSFGILSSPNDLTEEKCSAEAVQQGVVTPAARAVNLPASAAGGSVDPFAAVTESFESMNDSRTSLDVLF